MKPLFFIKGGFDIMYKILKFFGKWKLYRERVKTKYNQQMWEARRPLVETQNQIDQEKKELLEKHIQIKFPSWSKLLLVFLFANFTVLEIFIGWVTIKSFSLALSIGTMPDFTPLITLISAVVGQTLSYGVYAFKSKAENTKDGIIYETAMAELQSDTYEEGGVG